MAPLWFVVLGILSLVVSGVLQQYCEISRRCRPELRAKVFTSRLGLLLEIGWIVLLATGGVLLWLAYPIVGIVAIVMYWLLFPLAINQRLKRRMLPPWNVVKGDLAKLGYTQYNYLRGDWWKKEKAKEVQLHLRSRKTQDSDASQDQRNDQAST